MKETYSGKLKIAARQNVKEKKYWTEVISDGFEKSYFAYDDKKIDETSALKSYNFTFPSDVAEKVRSFTNNNDHNLHMILLSSVTTLLYKYTNRETAVTGTAIYKQENDSDLINKILMIKSEIKDEITFKELLLQTRENLIRANENQNYPLKFIFDELELDHNEDASFPLYDVAVLLDSIHDVEYIKEIKNNINFIFSSSENELKGTIQYSTRYKESTIKRIIKHYKKLLSALTININCEISELDILEDDERNKVLNDFNAFESDYPRDKVIHELFEEQVATTPENIAVLFNDKSLTYRELNERANSLAKTIRDKGIKPDDIVAIMVERSIEMIVGTIAILKAGAAFLPIDVDYPIERKLYMADDCDIKLLLTTDKHMNDDFKKFEQIYLDSSEIYETQTGNPDNIVSSENLAYIMYTSGSTGKPKGVMVEHRNVVRLVKNTNYIELGEETRILQTGAPVFDATTFEIWGALLNGGGLYLVENEVILNANRLEEALKNYKINTLWLTAPLFNQLVQQSEQMFSGLEYLLIGGDVVSPQHIKIAKSHNKELKLLNCYGPTENTTFSTTFHVKDNYESNVPIGTPIANSTCYIVDKDLNLQPIGIAGELCVGGDGLARGYLNRPDLTAEKFVDNPFVPNNKMYRTGDLARWLPDGNIEFLGRIDQQVKIRGYRIELGEIENKLQAVEAIKEAAVMAITKDEGIKYLCAYYVSEEAIETAELRKALADSLPDYMIPSFFIHLDMLPLTANGKVDRKKLPQPEGGISTSVEYVAPTNEIEEILASIWQNLLGMEKVGILDNFFELGGDSIKVIQMTARLNNQGLKLEVRDIFSNPVIKELAPFVKKQDRMIEQKAVIGEIITTPIQKEFFKQESIALNHFNQSAMLYNKDGFDENALKDVYAKLLSHHDALRMIFQEGKLHNRDTEIAYDYFQVFDFSETENYEEAVAAEAERQQASLNIEEGILLKAILFKTAEGDHLLTIIHHLVIDGVSWRILMEDLKSGYEQRSQGKDIELPLKSDSFKYWSERLAEYSNGKAIAREAEYWKRVVSLDFERLVSKEAESPNRGKDYFEDITIELDAKKTEKLLTTIHKAYNTEINDILLSSLGFALKKWRGITNALINLEGHGREKLMDDVDISRTIGWFTSMFPISIKTDSEERGRQIRQVKEMLKRIPNKGVGFGILKHLSPTELLDGIETDIYPEISFNYLGQFDNDIQNDLFEYSSLSGGRDIGDNYKLEHRLGIDGLVAEGCLNFNISYHKEEFTTDDIVKLGEIYLEELEKTIEHCLSIEKGIPSPADFNNRHLTIDEFDSVIRKVEKISPNAGIEKISILSPMQLGMLFHYMTDKENSVYFEQTSYEINSTVEPELIKEAFKHLLARHDVLRTIFIFEDLSTPAQIVLDKPELEVTIEDYSNLDAAKKEKLIANFKESDVKRGFNLTTGPLIRLAVHKLEEEKYNIAWSFHHILMDGWCMGIIYNDFAAIYNSLSKGEQPDLAPAVQFSQYLTWLDQHEQDDSLEYWKNYLSGYENRTGLPKLLKNSEDDYIVKERGLLFDRDISEKLNNMAKKNQITLNALFQAIWSIMLHKYNNVEDVVFGAVVSGRPSSLNGVEEIVGLFINTVPVRVKISSEMEFVKLALAIHRNAIDSKEHEYCSLAKIQDLSIQKHELIDNIFVFENYPFNESKISDKEQDDIISNFESYEQTNYNLNLLLAPGEQIPLTISYNTLVYSDELINNVVESIKIIAREIAANSEVMIKDIDILGKAEKEIIINDFNSTERAYPSDKPIHLLFEEQAARVPDSIALVFGDESLTYRELNERANSLAKIIRDKGVKADDRVAIMVDRSIEMIVGNIAILKAGGAFLPIDVNYPIDRKMYMIDDCDVKVILSTQKHIGDDFKELEKIYLDNKEIFEVATENLNNIVTPENLAYIMYTSGSTGKPKGVMVKQRNVVRLVKNTNYIELGDNTKILQTGAPVFDATTFETWGALLNGGGLYLVENEVIINADRLKEALDSYNINTLFLTTALFNQLIQHSENMFSQLDYLFVGGDAASTKHFNMARKSSNTLTLINIYGPTENGAYSTFFSVKECMEGNIPIGTPIANSTCYIVDKNLNLQPIGVAGELCVGGDGLARGYLNRPDLTAEKFTDNPFVPGSKMYRTGDLARWLPDGNIEFLGRIDHQVKIRGFRIELGEIESKLQAVEGIKESVVMARTQEDGNKYLCAYYVSEEKFETLDLRKALASTLPDYMVPHLFIHLDKMPLTTNGKADRKSLPVPEGNIVTGVEYVAPSNETEEKLVAIWQELLGQEKIGILDNFFELGGHSLKGTLLSSMLKKEFEIDYPLREIFARPTIAECAEYIDGAEKTGYREITRVEDKAHYPLSSAQKRLFFLNRFDSESLAYNMYNVLKVEGKFDKSRFEETIKKLIERHDVLRTTFDIVDNEPVQIIHDEVDFSIKEHRITNVDYNQSDIEEILEQFLRPYDLAKAPLLRIELIKLPSEEHILLFDMHHIISDGTSMDILISEMFNLYNGEDLEPLEIQYKDFANWQNEFMKTEEMAKQFDYWKEVFKGDIPVITLPEDYRRPEVFDFQGDTYSFLLEKRELDNLKELTLKEDATLYISLLATLNIALKLYSGQDDIIIGSVIAGRRHHIALQKVMGMFVNTLAMRNFPANDKSFKNFLKEVKESCLGAFENQDVQFEELIEMFDVKRDTSRNPLFDIGFTLQNAQDEEKVSRASEDSEVDFAPFEYEESKTSTFDIDIDAYESGGMIQFDVSYCTSIYKESTIKRICDHWINIIRAVCNNPETLLGEIEILSKEEKEQILTRFNSQESNFKPEKSYIGYFEENAERNKDMIAAVHNGRELSYKELNEAANRTAHFLKDKGVSEGEIVALYFSRGLEMLTSMLAVMKAGAAFIAIDVDFPRERIKGILNDCGAVTLLTEPEWLDDVHELQDSLATLENILSIEEVEQIEQLLADYPVTNPGITPDGESLAYLIFTSGTTGRPKGAMIHYNGLLNHLIVNRDFLSLTVEDRFAQTASTGFDISIWQFLIMPLVGGTVEIIDKELILDPKRLINRVEKRGLTVLQLVPSLINELLKVMDEERKAKLAGLRWLIPTGEALPVYLAALWYKSFPAIPLVNAYGPAETSDDVTLHIVEQDADIERRSIPIGRPLPNFHVYIMDESNRLCPIGVPGEIAVAGVGVGKGYLNDEEKTAQSFIPNPFIDELENGELFKTVYKTGDIGYYRADGILEILGRRDHQVKLRGSRIELGEIEYQLSVHDKISEAVVILRKDSLKGDYLHGFYVSEEEVESGDLKLYLSDRVPGYMVPSYFSRLDAIPLTANGKTDRSALEAIKVEHGGAEEYIEPGNNIEATIAAVWSEVLRLERVSINDNFFDVGGHSLALIGVQSRLEEALGQNIAIATMFRYPTVSGLAQYLSEGGMTDTISDEEMEESVNIMEETFARMGEDE